MKEIIIKNKDILSILDEVLYFYKNRSELDGVIPYPADCKDDIREDYISEDYLKKIISMGDSHDGYPESMRAQSLALKTYSFKNPKENSTPPLDWLERYSEINARLMNELSVRNNALATMYPPGGYIGWHTNANATGFNLIFTWSETGDGWFDYIEDSGKGERVRCQDKAGQWVCRYGMFGAYHQDKYPIVYHAASTECWRITLSFVFSKEEAAGGLQEFIIEELTTP